MGTSSPRLTEPHRLRPSTSGNRAAYFALATTLVAAVALSFAAAAHDRLPGDLWLAGPIQELPESFESVAEATRRVTSTWPVVVAGLVIVTVFCFRSRRREWLVYSLILLALPFLQAGIKNAVDRPRPDPSLVERRATFTSESFPSGHVMSGTAVILLIAWIVADRTDSPRARIAVWGIAVGACVLNGVANVYEGVHWPSDVLGGCLWALVLVTAALLATRTGARRSPG